MARINWRRVFRPGGLGHPAKHTRYGYALVSSFRGLKWAKRLRKKDVDRDLRRSRDHRTVVNHWSLLYKDGWKVAKNVRLEDLNLAQLRALRHPLGLRMHTLEEDLVRCAELGLGAKLEPKSNDPAFHDPDYWRGVKATADRLGVRVTGYALKANADAVPAMRAAGIPAKVLDK